jgi:hypothetical protein
MKPFEPHALRRNLAAKAATPRSFLQVRCRVGNARSTLRLEILCECLRQVIAVRGSKIESLGTRGRRRKSSEPAQTGAPFACG